MNVINENISENPYLLLTPGPLTTTKTVKSVMLRDYCTWDDDYHVIIRTIRSHLVRLSGGSSAHTATLMQGSGTYCVEGTLSTSVPDNGKLLILSNGAYGRRMAEIAKRARIPYVEIDFGETDPIFPARVADALENYADITHVSLVHLETTTGMLNPAKDVCNLAKSHGKTVILDAMSSFGGIPINMAEYGADFLISSANKCIQGVPGFGFILSDIDELKKCEGRARSLSLDVYDQWKTMEEKGGKWRFTSPTHVVRAFARALEELDEEGGVEKRYERYRENQRRLVTGMKESGFAPLLPEELQSPVITAFHSPKTDSWNFNRFYALLKERGFVIYPGKVTKADTFRIGNIGDVKPDDINRLIEAVKSVMWW